MADRKLPFRIGTKRTRVGKFPHAFETERKIYGGLPGSKVKAHYQHVPARPPTLTGIIAALKQVKSPTFSIRVLGKLKETPEDYKAEDFPAHEWLYLGQVRDTVDALQAALDVPVYLRGNTLATLHWINDWSNFEWEEVATVYIAER